MDKETLLATIDEVIASYTAADPCSGPYWSCTRLSMAMHGALAAQPYELRERKIEDVLSSYKALASKCAETAGADSLLRKAAGLTKLPYWWSSTLEYKEERIAMLTEFRTYVENEYVCV